MSTKIKLDLANGLLEVEGAEAFVRSVYDDFKERTTKDPVTRPVDPAAARAGAAGSDEARRSTSKKRAQLGVPQNAAPRKKLRQPSTIKTLDLSKGPGGRLRDFYDSFEVKTNFERNLIFIYFLQQKMGIESGITQDHVFTCYRDIPGVKVPGALRQSLLDTDKDKGWIDAADPENLRISVHGLNHIEHDLQRKHT